MGWEDLRKTRLLGRLCLKWGWHQLCLPLAWWYHFGSLARDCSLVHMGVQQRTTAYSAIGGSWSAGTTLVRREALSEILRKGHGLWSLGNAGLESGLGTCWPELSGLCLWGRGFGIYLGWRLESWVGHDTDLGGIIRKWYYSNTIYLTWVIELFIYLFFTAALLLVSFVISSFNEKGVGLRLPR